MQEYFIFLVQYFRTWKYLVSGFILDVLRLLKPNGLVVTNIYVMSILVCFL